MAVFVNRYLLMEFLWLHLCPDNRATKESASENPSTNGFYPSSKPLPHLFALPESTPASNNPSFTAARGIFLNRSAHATPLIISFYGLNYNLNCSPRSTWCWGPEKSRCGLVSTYVPSSVAPPRAPFCSSSTPRTPPTSHLHTCCFLKPGTPDPSTVPGI